MTPLPDRAEEFLGKHPALRAAQSQSAVWPQIKEEAAVQLPTGRWYLVGGDTLGSESALWLDRLARGARSEGADPSSRDLFLELSAELQAVVRRELLLETSD